MSPVTPAVAVGEIVARDPRAAEVFERLGIDYCCGGRRTLAEACAQRGLDAATVAALLASPARAADGDDDHDVSRATIGQLCDHIVVAHHDRLRRELPEISRLAATVVRVHGRDHPELADVQRVFERMRTELEEHLGVEERELFPRCRGLESPDAEPAGLDAGLLALLEDDHETTGAALLALREMTGGYDAGCALCGTHRRLLDGLAALERDVHRHVHEENNLLFERVRARLEVAR